MAYEFGQIVDCESGKVLFDKGVKPVCFWSRFRGLQLRRELHDGAAWWFDNCKSVHTFNMRYKIDVIYISSEGVVLKVVANVPKRRISYCRDGSAVIEVGAGIASEFCIQPGVKLEWVDD